MTTVNVFNAVEWLSQNTRGGTFLSPATQEVVASFTIMWNFFESTLCNNRASVSAFDKALEYLVEDDVSQDTMQALDDCRAFWSSRYLSRERSNDQFNGLCFRGGDRQDFVEDVLAGNLSRTKEKLLALMIIVYRLRNNLFHGLKSIDRLNDQAENLSIATHCIAAILNAFPSRLVLSPRNRLSISSRPLAPRQ